MQVLNDLNIGKYKLLKAVGKKPAFYFNLVCQPQCGNNENLF